MKGNLKPLDWLGSAKRDIQILPGELQRAFGVALLEVQFGGMPSIAKPLTGFGPGVLELRENDADGTYRVVYVIRFDDRIYVLHVFQKKAKRGISTPKQDVALIRARLKLAESDHAQRRMRERKQ